MPEGFELFAKDWGPASLVSFFVIAIAIGFLSPRWTVNKLLAEKELRIKEALRRETEQKEANEKLQKTIEVQADQLGTLMEQARTTLAIVASIEAAAASTGQGRHHAKGG